MRSYGSIESNHAVPRSGKRSLTRVLRISLVAMGLAAVVITIAALSKGPAIHTLISKSQHGSQFTSLEEGESGSSPTAEDVASFKAAGTDALATLGVTDLSETGLEDSCGIALYACAQKIISCADSRLVKNAKGEITPLTSVCNCFVRGYTETIDIPGDTHADLTCPYNCVDDLMKFAAKHVADANGANGATLTCDLSNLASKTFGNKNQYITSDGDTDSMEPVSIDAPEVKRAAEALRINFNAERVAKCPATRSYDEPGTIKYAKHGIAEDGKSQYRLEVVFGNDVVFARIAHLPRSEQLVDPTMQAQLGDTDNLNGRFLLVSSVPGPCDDGVPEQLAVSAEGSEAINKQNLPWTASLRAEHEGKKVKDFGLGDVALSAEERKAFYVELDTTDFTPPAAYDARDIYAGQVPCKAYQALNQGSCGSCYAFAAASAYNARLCRFNPSSLGNTLVSPQEMIDCSNGCDGGNSLYVFQTMETKPNVEMWCDPYSGTKQTCGGVCGGGNAYSGLPGSVRTVGGAGPNGVLQMQLELIRGGPGVVSFMVVNDIFAYSKGIYVPSATAAQVGGHAVALVGWGVENGVPYWICQNSWGAGWGENGFFRIGRGSDVATIESRSGLAVIKPAPPTACPTANCAPGLSTTLKDCTCRCDTVARTGPQCTTCALSCQNGGIMDAGCTKCSCPLGFSGPMCEGGFTLAPLASCVGDGTIITVTYSFAGLTRSPTQTSTVGIYPLAETGPFKYLASGSVCGSTYPSYSATVNGGLCPTSGTFKITAPSTPGQYKIVLSPFSPPNAQGVSGFYALSDSNIIGQFTVLPSGCAAADKATALASNNAGAILNGRLAAAATAEAAQLAAMKVRLDAVQPLLATLVAEEPASLTITGMDTAKRLVWAGTANQMCFRIPPSANVNPKNLLLYIGDGSSGTYYPTALGAAGNAPLPADYQGCTKFVPSAGVPMGPYTIIMQDSTTSAAFASISFTLAKAAVSYTTYTVGSLAVTVTTSWTIAADRASPLDTVRLVNSQGTVIYWYYTFCKCQTTPLATDVPVLTGTATIRIVKLNAVIGGYTLTFNPGGGNTIGAVAPNWIPWANLGL